MARYDGVARWYDDYVTGAAASLTARAQETITGLLGPGRGTVLDVGCGTGVHIGPLVQAGWSVTGVDVSIDQLRVAHQRTGSLDANLVAADGANLPFHDSTFDAVISVLTHTDVEDIAAVFREAARVLRPRGRLIYVGTHPCFVSPFVETVSDHRVLHAGYRQSGWHQTGPGLGADGIRRRVGVRHVPLSELLAAFLDSGLALELLDEPGADDPPTLITLAGRSVG